MDSKTQELLQKFASQKVELGKIQDLDKITSSAYSLIAEAENRIEQARDSVNKAYQITDQLEDAIIKGENIANDIEGVFKELDSKLTPDAKKAIEKIKDLEKEQRRLVSAIKNVI